MTNTKPMPSSQLGFDAVLAEAKARNQATRFERTCGHLPTTMDEALPCYRSLIERHHAAAMLEGDGEETVRLREEAARLALRLNNGEPGILAGPDAPGCVLARLTAAEIGAVPLWGQVGSFTVEAKGCVARIDMDGLFGIGACYTPWMNFSANAIDRERPFLSPTGFRSFLGLQANLVAGMTTEVFAAEVVAAFIGKELKGRLVAIDDRYRQAARSGRDG